MKLRSYNEPAFIPSEVRPVVVDPLVNYPEPPAVFGDARRTGEVDRDLALALRNTIRRNDWRIKAGLPLRPAEQDKRRWAAWLGYLFATAAWRKSHPRQPTPTPHRAA